MKPVFRRSLLLSLGLWTAAGLPAGAKPPDLPTEPETEFKVLSPLGQEYNQPDEPVATSIFVPLATWLPGSAAAAALGGAWTQLNCWHTTKATDQKARLVHDVFAVAEAYRQEGNWDEAKRWYTGVTQLYPGSAQAKLAEAQLERLALLRVAAEAGEEQSEEPPIASVERLTVMPRSVRMWQWSFSFSVHGPLLDTLGREILTIVPREVK